MINQALQQLRDSRRLTNKDFAFHFGNSNGEWVKICQYFYLPASTWQQLQPFQQQWVRNVAVGRAVHTAVLIGRAAADVHGLWVIARNPYDIELALPNASMPPKRQWAHDICYRRAVIPPEHSEFVANARTVSAARAVIDIARYHGFAEGLVAADSFLRKQPPGSGRKELQRVLTQMGRVVGISVVRRVIAEADARSESPYESLARAILLEAGWDVRVQVSVLKGVRVDLMVGNVVIEIDGAVKYDGETFGKAPDEVIVHEREREKLLRNHGFDVVRVSPQQLLQHPEMVVEWVEQALQRAA